MYGFGRGSQGSLRVHVTVQIVFGPAKTIMHGRVDLDHVLIAGEDSDSSALRSNLPERCCTFHS